MRMISSGPGRGFLVPGSPFSTGELSAMALAGDIHSILSGVWCTAPPPWTLADRAAAVQTLLVDRPVAMVCGDAAAWIHTGGALPAVIELTTHRFHRPERHRSLHPLRVVEWDLAEAESVLIAGTPVATPERTAFDLLFHESSESHVLQRLAALAQRPEQPVDVERLRERVRAAGRRPGKLHAVGLLDRFQRETCAHPCR
ncbi:hypothetical protein GCM10027591_01840 [Zhihengliuella somnathii]